MAGNSIWDSTGGNMWDEPKRRKKRKTNTSRRRKTSYRRRSSSNNEIDPFTAGVLLIVLFSYMTYVMFIKDNIEAIKFYGSIVGVIIILCGIGYLIYKYKQRQKNKLVEKIRIDSIPEFINELNDKISGYVPLRNHTKEEPYQMELAGFLRNKYETLDIEVSKNYARPDIVIDDIAIEIKGPTGVSELKTIPDKIIRYLKEWDYLYIVLFNVRLHNDKQTSDEMFETWKNDIFETFESKKDKIFIIDLGKKST